MEKREIVDDAEETLRVVFAGMMREYHFATPCVMTEDTKDGHRCTPQPSIQRTVTDPVSGLQSFVDHPLAPDTPIHYAGGGKVVATHPVKAQDEGLIVYADRALDVPMQQGGTGQPIDSRQHHAGDGMYVPGIRSDPKKLQQVDNDAHHVRSVDKRSVSETHPDHGVSHFHADPSTPPASADFDPHTQATKYVRHYAWSSLGAIGVAVDGSTTHSHGSLHGIGSWLKAMGSGGLVQALAHPDIGGLLSSADGKHTVQAHPTNGVQIASQTAVAISAPPGMMSLSGLASGSIDGAALAPGAASQNVGTVGGDLAGNLPNPTVTGLHVDFSRYPAATSDSAAAMAGVGIGGLYRDTSIASGKSVLVVRMV